MDIWRVDPGRYAVSRRTDFHIANAVAALSAAPDPKACLRIFRRAIAPFKIDSFACGEVDLAAPERTVFYAIDWPDSYRRFYFGNGLSQRDPLLEALKGRHEPLTWSELQRDRKQWSAIGTRALQVIAEHGWTDGLAVPIPRGDQRFGLVSLQAGKRRPFDANDKSALAMLSYCLHERLRNLAPTYGFAIPPVGLTGREIDALRLIARGATDRDVARKLGIAPSTAHEHIEKAKLKLQVSTRAEAIAIAVSLAIVAP
jgi:LuxR family transcriptional regulator, quorum-sensing system regulator BjaR1